MCRFVLPLIVALLASNLPIGDSGNLEICTAVDQVLSNKCNDVILCDKETVSLIVYFTARLIEMGNRFIKRRVELMRQDYKAKICFGIYFQFQKIKKLFLVEKCEIFNLEHVGCFADFPPHLSFRRPPQHPNVIQTRFLLYTRANKDVPDVIVYGDNLRSLNESRFNASKPLNVICHGYKGSGTDTGAILGAHTWLDLASCKIKKKFFFEL